MVCFPNAKVNIGLFILRKRVDGYHDVESVMVPIDWCDVLEVVPAKGTETTLSVTGNHVDCEMEKNLVVKAYRRLAERVELPPVDIYLHKVIPDGAGLGGGSSDAAFMLKLLNEMFALEFGDDDLADIASELGADCPFFIYNKPMLATGTGTTLAPIDVDLSGYKFVVVKPDEYVSTAEAYAGVHPKEHDVQLAQLIGDEAPSSWHEGGVVNDFEQSVFAKHPVIGDVKQQLMDCGAVYASMSGSGSAVYGIFADDKLAVIAEKSMSRLRCFRQK